MTHEDIVTRIERYLRGNDTRPRIVNFQNRESIIAFRKHFDVGSALFRYPSDYCKPDEDLTTEDLYEELSHLQEAVFLVGFTTHFRLYGREALQQFIANIATLSFVSGKLVLVCYQCSDFLRFRDKRLQDIVYFSDDAISPIPSLRLLAKELPSATNEKATAGIENAGILVESSDDVTVCVHTQKRQVDYPESMIFIEELSEAYSVLCEIDQATHKVAEGLGTPEQWLYALKGVFSNGSWNSYINHAFGAVTALEHIISRWRFLSEEEKWLYLIALKLFGSPHNNCLAQAANLAQSTSELVRYIFRSILEIDCSMPAFKRMYSERKQLLQQMFGDEPNVELIDYINLTKRHQYNSIRYLTNNTRLEKEAIVDLICSYSGEYTDAELLSILRVVFPDLATYLTAYSFQDQPWLDDYFTEYRYSKVRNIISSALLDMAQKQAVDRDFFKLPPRIAKVDAIPKAGSFLFFVDAMGVEYVPYIVRKCREMELTLSVAITHCELPSLTRHNKDFFETFAPKHRAKVSELDDIKHHGKENFDYQVTKTPQHLIRELEIVDEILRKAKMKLASGEYSRVLLVSDHGATRMAVINEQVINIDVNSKGSNGGRVCEYTDAVVSVPFAVKEKDYYVLASYDRFKGGHPAMVETHGGATLEEVLVPVVELRLSSVEYEIDVLTPIVDYSFKEAPVLKIFSKTPLSEVSVLVNGHWYPAEKSQDGHHFDFVLSGIKRGPYTALLYSAGNEIATDLAFQARNKVGSTTNKSGIL